MHAMISTVACSTHIHVRIHRHVHRAHTMTWNKHGRVHTWSACHMSCLPILRAPACRACASASAHLSSRPSCESCIRCSGTAHPASDVPRYTCCGRCTLERCMHMHNRLSASDLERDRDESTMTASRRRRHCLCVGALCPCTCRVLRGASRESICI